MSPSNLQPLLFSRVATVASHHLDPLNLEYFQFQILPQLANGIEAKLWVPSVLQIAATESMVCHSALATAALHRTYCPVEGITHRGGRFELSALQHYHMAVRRLLKLSPQDLRMQLVPVLISCVLLILFEARVGGRQSIHLEHFTNFEQILRDDLVAARRHIRGGIQILEEHSTQSQDVPMLRPQSHRLPHPIFLVILDALRMILTRLDFQASVFESRDAKPLPMRSRSWTQYFDTSELQSTSHAFESTFHADAHLDCLLYNGIRLRAIYEAGLNEQDTALLREVQLGAFRDFGRWKDAVWAYRSLSDHNDLSLSVRRHAIVLQVRERSKDILFVGVQGGDEFAFDGALNLFQEILRLAKELSQLSPKVSTGLPWRERPFSFLLRNEINIPLFMVAWKCREPTVRYEAIRLLDERNTIEGLWSSALLADLARKIAGAEQRPTASVAIEKCILPEARVCKIEVLSYGLRSWDMQIYFQYCCMFFAEV